MQDIEELNIPSDPEELSRVNEFAEHIAREMGFSAEERDDITISVTEVVNNAIVHGNGLERSKRVVIIFRKNQRCLTVSVLDQGAGFDPETDLIDPTSPENLLKEKGRGIFIVRHLMDEVSFRRRPEGMEVILVKYLKS